MICACDKVSLLAYTTEEAGGFVGCTIGMYASSHGTDSKKLCGLCELYVQWSRRIEQRRGREMESGDERICKRLVEQMTLEEKISQMRYESPAIERLHIPAYNWWNEALHGVARSGVATMFPQAIALAATFDEELIEKIGDVVSTEGRAKFEAYSGRGDRGIYKGLTFWAPNINIFRDPRWGEDMRRTGRIPV